MVHNTEGLPKEEVMLHIYPCLVYMYKRTVGLMDGLTRLGNLYTCAMPERTDTATKGTLISYTFQQTCSKEA